MGRRVRGSFVSLGVRTQDFKAAGSGVRLGQRLVVACTRYTVLIGEIEGEAEKRKTAHLKPPAHPDGAKHICSTFGAVGVNGNI